MNEFKNNPLHSTHSQLKVEVALKMTNRDIIEWIGEPLSKVKADLVKMKEAGRVYVHADGCDNEDPITGKCLGHKHVVNQFVEKAYG